MAEQKNAGATTKPNTAAPKTTDKGIEKNASKKSTDRDGIKVTSFRDLKEPNEALPGVVDNKSK